MLSFNVFIFIAFGLLQFFDLFGSIFNKSARIVNIRDKTKPSNVTQCWFTFSGQFFLFTINLLFISSSRFRSQYRLHHGH